jgi:hypothetical protein
MIGTGVLEHLAPVAALSGFVDPTATQSFDHSTTIPWAALEQRPPDRGMRGDRHAG